MSSTVRLLRTLTAYTTLASGSSRDRTRATGFRRFACGRRDSSRASVSSRDDERKEPRADVSVTSSTVWDKVLLQGKRVGKAVEGEQLEVSFGRTAIDA